MKKLLSNLIKLHKDKVYHFFCSYTAMLTFTALAIIKWESPITWSVNFGIAMAILVGVVKEIWDKLTGGKLSVGDLVADGLGIAIAFLIVGV